MGTSAWPSRPAALRFGNWELRIASRELLLADRLQEVEPKVFDLLVYLIQHQQRVVRREELLEHVWGNAPVVDNVIARTVMKARKAIGDKADGNSLIRTVHRVGYRFVGDPIGGEGAVAVSSAPPVPLPEPLLRFGLLPFDNLTGDTDLGWIERGLTALVCQALESDRRISVVPTTAILTALASVGTNAGAESAGRTVERLLGLQCVVHTTVRRRGGRYRLDYHAVGVRSGGVAGELVADEPTVLAERLAHRLEAQLFPHAQASVGFQSDDIVANQTFARAMQACAEERWQSAAKLLQVVLDIEPQSTAAATEYLWVLATLGDPASFVLGERLLQQALAAGDSKQAAHVHHALARAHLDIEGPRQSASLHMDAALGFATQHGAADWVLKIYTTQALAQQLTRNFARARQLYDQAARGYEAAGNRMEVARIMNNCAAMDAMSGNLLGARNWMEEALRISKELALNSNMAVGGGNLALANAELGFLRMATEQCDTLVGRIALVQDGRLAASFALTLCIVYAEWPQLEKIDAVLAALHARPGGITESMQPGLRMAEGVRAAARSDVHGACALLREGVRLSAALGETFMVGQWLPLLLQAELTARDADAVRAVCDQIENLPSFRDDDKLQGLVLRAQGVRLHAEGDVAAACSRLLDATQRMPIGLWNAYAKLDAAWLHLECGQVAMALQLLRDIRPWVDEHPLGWLVQARLKAATGGWAEAVVLQQRVVDVAAAAPPSAYHLELLAIYERAAREAGEPLRAAALPPAPSLPTFRGAAAAFAARPT